MVPEDLPGGGLAAEDGAVDVARAVGGVVGAGDVEAALVVSEGVVEGDGLELGPEGREDARREVGRVRAARERAVGPVVVDGAQARRRRFREVAKGPQYSEEEQATGLNLGKKKKSMKKCP